METNPSSDGTATGGEEFVVRDFWLADDEYVCLLPPLLERLASGVAAEEIARFLNRNLAGHFGTHPALLRIPAAQFAATAVAAWAERHSVQ